MDRVGKSEAATQKRVIEFFQMKLRYNYIGNLKDQANRNIDEEKLIGWLIAHGYSSTVATRAVEELVKAATNLQEGLYTANRAVYQLLKYGAKSRKTLTKMKPQYISLTGKLPAKTSLTLPKRSLWLPTTKNGRIWLFI